MVGHQQPSLALPLRPQVPAAPETFRRPAGTMTGDGEEEEAEEDRDEDEEYKEDGEEKMWW